MTDAKSKLVSDLIRVSGKHGRTFTFNQDEAEQIATAIESYVDEMVRQATRDMRDYADKSGEYDPDY
jgi:hypothetical protein